MNFPFSALFILSNLLTSYQCCEADNALEPKMAAPSTIDGWLSSLSLVELREEMRKAESDKAEPLSCGDNFRDMDKKQLIKKIGEHVMKKLAAKIQKDHSMMFTDEDKQHAMNMFHDRIQDGRHDGQFASDAKK
ncbi:hypothetical protein HDE_01482 [Halotydeus destructor]|nr:hypothetical protein HDE_01482 [Halotydeus destructor]